LLFGEGGDIGEVVAMKRSTSAVPWSLGVREPLDWSLFQEDTRVCKVPARLVSAGQLWSSGYVSVNSEFGLRNALFGDRGHVMFKSRVNHQSPTTHYKDLQKHSFFHTPGHHSQSLQIEVIGIGVHVLDSTN
jgi:hypothetical protein